MKAERIPELAGSGRWEGDVAEMRGDRPCEPRPDALETGDRTRQPRRGAPVTGRESGV